MYATKALVWRYFVTHYRSFSLKELNYFVKLNEQKTSLLGL